MRLPSLFDTVDAAAAANQQRFLRTRLAELTLLMVAAVTSLIPIPPARLIVVVALGAAFVLRASKNGAIAERRWHEARSVAESLKSEAWQYAVGGAAFRVTDDEADNRFRNHHQEYSAELSWLDIPADPATPHAISDDMAHTRSSDATERLTVYESERVQDQLEWYSGKSDFNRSRSERWKRGMLAAELLGVLVGLAILLGDLEVNWISTLTGVAAAIAAWQQTRRYSELSMSYATASHDVSVVLDTLRSASSEAEWAQVVHDAEAAFSREHTLWRARRQGPL